ncbi:MAG: peptidase M23 [Cryomorphaceae bacterium]|jgi:murein DD-endopeptidase MepM/ murein hydrolase activator NlpD|nr:peptidase M23 [Cryomorphaceae bacterium]|tara:strand:+ start:14329 stop:15306 length:978 start_codon:yes stop_codon:yes gene_type:complete
MRKSKYIYDPLTLAYKKVDRTWKHILRDTSLFLLASSLLGVLFFFVIQLVIDSPKEKSLKRELDEVLLTYEQLDERLNKLMLVLGNMEKRDDEIYRVIFESEPPPAEIRLSGLAGGALRYESIRDFSNGVLLEKTSRKVDELTKRIAIQSESLDELASLANNKEALLDALPAIRPVKDQPGTRFSSGFGYRIHPIYKVRKKHPGVDFSAKKGTPIYASANGIVISNDIFGGRGFGKHITISHGFGYHTLYAHMDKAIKKRGQRVKRGDLIGYIGNTGRSTAPHLHYEVIKNGRRVNPINYFFNDLSPTQYDDLVRSAAISNQSFD